MNIYGILISASIIMAVAVAISYILGKKVENSDDWAVGGRSLPIYVIVMTQYATAVGGGLLVAHVGIAYANGFSELTYGIFLLGGLGLLSIIAKWLRSNKFSTVPDIFKNLYGENRIVHYTATIMSIIVPFGWMGSQMSAFGRLFSTITGVPYPLLIVIFGVICLALVIPAGLTSVAWTDFIFGTFMIIMSFISLGFMLNMAGGLSKAFSSVPKEMVSFPKGLGTAGGATIMVWFLAVLPGTLTNQLYYQRIYATDSVRNARKSLIISIIVMSTAFIWATIMGVSIRSINPNLADSSDAAGWFFTQLPMWFMAIYSGFIIATMVSTTDSAIQSISVNIVRDIYQNVTKNSDEKRLLKISKLVSFLVAVTGVIMAIFFSNVLSWLVFTYALSASSLLFPIFLGYALKGKGIITTQGVVGSMVFGFIGCVLGDRMDLPIPYVALGLGFSLIALFVVSLITRPKGELKTSKGV